MLERTRSRIWCCGADTTCARFDGTNGCLSHAHVESLELEAGTFIVLLKPAASSLGANRGVFSKDRRDLNEGDATFYYFNEVRAFRWQIQTATVQHTAAVSKSFIPEGQPKAVACTFGGAGLQVYVDGVLRASNTDYTGGISANTINPLFVAATGFSGTPSTPADFWSGHIDHLQLYRRQLTEAEIAALSPFAPTLYDAVVTPYDPVLWLKLDDASGTPANSGSGSASVAVTGTPDYSQSTPKGNGVRLGAGEFITVTNTAALFGTDPGGSDVWVDSECGVIAECKIHTLADNVPLVSMDDDESDVGTWAWSIRAMADGSLILRTRSGGRPIEMATPAGVVEPGTSFHVAAVWGRDGVGW